MPETNGKDLSGESVPSSEGARLAGEKYQKEILAPKAAALAKQYPGLTVAEIADRVAAEELPGLTETEMAALAPPKAPAAGAMSADKAESILDAQVMNIVGVVTRGLIVSSAGVPPDVLLRSMARCFARVVGEAIAGDLVPVLQVRTSVREAFERTLKTTPIKPAPQPQRMPGNPQMRG